MVKVKRTAPPKIQFQFEDTPLIPTTSSTNIIGDGFFSGNSVYGDSTTMGGSSIGGSLNGDDHMNDLLGVLNKNYDDDEYDQEGRYHHHYHHASSMNDKNNGTSSYLVGERRGEDGSLDSHCDRMMVKGGISTPVSPKSRKGYVEDTTPRKMKQQEEDEEEGEREVRVSVVTPNQKQRGTTTKSSPTSIFSFFNCGDFSASDISETLSLIFSPVTNSKRCGPDEAKEMKRDIKSGSVVKDVVQELQVDNEEEDDDDEEEEERRLMQKLQRIREKKWRGGGGGGGGRRSSRAKARMEPEQNQLGLDRRRMA